MRCISQERVAVSAGLFLDGLLGSERRKTGWMRAEAAGDPGPWRQQAILGRGRWEADALRNAVREYVVESLADQEAVLVLDETLQARLSAPGPQPRLCGGRASSCKRRRSARSPFW
jgi:SRSO17 transposase